jgi:uncharacterized protein (TIGR02145 family)
MKLISTFFISILLIFDIHAQVTDIDGNTYETVTIGNQEWFTQNLKTSHLNDGTPIELISDNNQWTSSMIPAMCWYNNDSQQYHPLYGRMYNGYAALQENICPNGWNVPSTEEWDQMINFLGGSSVAGGKLKQTGLEHWDSPNEGATNESKFTALPSGWRSNSDGQFNWIGQRAGWFVTMRGNDVAFRWVSWSTNASGTGAIAQNVALAVRCMRNLNNSSTKHGNEVKQIKVFPNPANNFITILPNHNITYKILITNMIGQVVIQENNNISQVNLDVSSLPNGLYMVKLEDNNGHLIQHKITISH